MPRLIDADALEKRHCEDCGEIAREICKNDPVCATLMWLREAPTIDPESLRPHGRWGIIILNKENKTICIECAECGADFTIPLFDFGLCYHYCPNCGAKMDEEGEPE